MTISVSLVTLTTPLGVVCTTANGSASAKRVIPGMKILSPCTTGRFCRPRRAKPSIPGPNFTFCLLAITGDMTSFLHSSASTFETVTLSRRLTPAFFLIIPSILMIAILLSSGLLRQYIAAVERFSPLINTMSPGFKSSPESPEILALPCPTSDGIDFSTVSEIVSF